MTVSKEKIEAKIEWYNNQILDIKDKFVKWLKELGHSIEVSDIKIQKMEELSGTYDTHQFDLKIDNTLKISLVPYAIWIVGAEGRIEVSGPAGSEKLVFFLKGGPALTTSLKYEGGKQIESHTQKYFSNIDEKNWYWYNDSTYRKVSKFNKEIIEPLLESVQ